MKRKMILLLGIMVLALGLVGTPASWADTVTFQGVTFNLNEGGGGLVFEINGVNGANLDWTGIDQLVGFQFKGLGIDPATSTLTLANFSVQEEVSFDSTGCGGPGNPQGSFCFTATPIFNLANNNTFNIGCTGTCGFNLSDNHLQILFAGADVPNGHGSLFSDHIGTSVPEPASLLLLGAGLAGIGLSQWKRRKAGQA